MDELRDSIWAYLYRAGEPRSVESIAAFTGQDVQTVATLVDHEWFTTADGQIAIAY